MVDKETAVLNQARMLGPIIAALALAASCAAAAMDVGGRRVTLGGFGTIGALYHDAEGIEYRRSASQPRGAQAGEVDFATDTLGGVQLNAHWNPEIDAVIQAVTRLTADDDWQPQLTRAFVRYNPTETLTLRAGRIGWEIYPRADSRDVGYSQLTIRPSVEVFGISPMEHFDGAELGLKHPLGKALIAAKVYGGYTEGKLARSDGSVTKVADSKLWGAHVEYQRGPWVVRLGSGVFEQGISYPLGGLAAGLQATGVPQAVTLGEEFARDGRKSYFYVGGLAYDEGPLQARLFGAHVHPEHIVSPDINVGQLIAGYRIGTLTPYASYSFVENTSSTPGTGLPDTPEYAALNAGVSMALAGGQYNQSSASLGLRYDFMPRLALKVQVDHVWLDGSRLVFDRRPDPADDAEMTLLGVALDFVF